MSTAFLKLVGSALKMVRVSKAEPLPVEPLGTPTVPWQLAATTVSASQILTTTCRRVSMKARGCPMRYVVTVGAGTANSSASHYMSEDERLDLNVLAGSTISVIRSVSAAIDGVLELTELA